MFDHVGLKVQDLKSSSRFYTAALTPLHLVPDDAATGFGAPGSPMLWLYQNSAETLGAPVHLAFRAPSRTAVEQFHRAGIEAGGRDHGAPGLRADYSPDYYAAFLLDPDGNNVEAVCYSRA
jgi:catechol 2,3-dioxygenase-like lactoylglutathione lyase family enzyme